MTLASRRFAVIKKRNSDVYVAAKDSWTSKVKEAWKFASGVDAYEFAMEQQLFDCDVLVGQEDSKPGVRISVRPTD